MVESLTLTVKSRTVAFTGESESLTIDSLMVESLTGISQSLTVESLTVESLLVHMSPSSGSRSPLHSAASSFVLRASNLPNKELQAVVEATQQLHL